MAHNFCYHSAQCLLLSVWMCGWMFSLTPLRISSGKPTILLQAACLLRPFSWNSCLVTSLLQPWGGPLSLCLALGDICSMVSVTLLFHLKQQYSKCPHLNSRFFLTGYESCPVSPQPSRYQSTWLWRRCIKRNSFVVLPDLLGVVVPHMWSRSHCLFSSWWRLTYQPDIKPKESGKVKRKVILAKWALPHEQQKSSVRNLYHWHLGSRNLKHKRHKSLNGWTPNNK